MGKRMMATQLYWYRFVIEIKLPDTCTNRCSCVLEIEQLEGGS